MFERLARLAGLGAFGAGAGLAGLFGAVIYLTLPGSPGGMDLTSSLVTWIALGGVTAALITVHVAIGRQLLRLGQGAERRHPL
jgi:hypothetical protein